ncbi:MAG: SCP2 sterol-binding domain-containing protein [Rhodobacteraceae bacterium]|nr:SCP2 sterol-binding domain-containing protein [Paracoccaceae bacterium]
MNIEAVIIEELQKLQLGTISQKVKFEVKDIGSFVFHGQEVLASNENRECTLIASLDTFKGLLRGRLNPALIYMNGELKIKGDVAIAMQLGRYLNNITRD